MSAACPIFNGNVGGAADYSVGLESTTTMALPCCFVYPVSDDPAPNEDMGGALRQLVQERIAVVVCVDNSADRRGQAGADSIEAIKYALFAGILNFYPSDQFRANQGLRYGGGHLLGFDRARLFWNFEFVLNATISEDDGWLYVGQPLREITITDTDHPPLVIGIALPQP
jgi:hypothetical protein